VDLVSERPRICEPFVANALLRLKNRNAMVVIGHQASEKKARFRQIALDVQQLAYRGGRSMF
jgi:hypothetical protein